MYLREHQVVLLASGISEIRDLHTEVVRNQQILRLEVSVNNTVLHGVWRLVKIPAPSIQAYEKRTTRVLTRTDESTYELQFWGIKTTKKQKRYSDQPRGNESQGASKNEVIFQNKRERWIYTSILPGLFDTRLEYSWQKSQKFFVPLRIVSFLFFSQNSDLFPSDRKIN